MSNFPGQWSSNTKLTGNSQFVVDSSDHIWIVSNLATGAGIYKSVDNGVTFTLITTIPDRTESTVAFDPALCLDSSGVLHFIGQRNGTDGIDLLYYSYNPANSILAGPYPILSGSVIGADYDIVAFATGSAFVVGSVINNQTETLYGLVINSAGSVTSTVTIASTGLFLGNRLGSVSLITPDGLNTEIYLGSHPKKVMFTDYTLTLELISVSSGGSYSTPTTLGQFQVRHSDDRLTVIAQGTARYLSQGVYYQQGSQLIGVLLLGYLSGSSGTWSFTQLVGTPTSSYVEPVLCVNPSELVCAYITKDLTQLQPVNGIISIYTLDPTTWTFLPRSDFHGSNRAAFLRGTHSTFSNDLLWGFLGQDSTGNAKYYTGYNAPPVAIVQPSTLNAIRGVTYELDASMSYDPNQDPIEFTWALTDITGTAILIPNGSTATLLVPNSIGPGMYTLGVTVNVTDYTDSGTPIHSPVSASVVITVTDVVVPTISGAASRNAARNALVIITPVITSAPNTTLTYSWRQTSGTTLRVIGLSNGPNIEFSTAGANLAGETIVFQLTVSDDINAPVSYNFNVVIPENTNTGPANYLARSVWSGNIAQRNSPGTWPTPTVSSIYSNFNTGKRGCILLGENFITYVGTQQVLTVGDDEIPSEIIFRSIFLPDSSQTVVDALHTETDYTVVLTSSGNLLQYLGGDGMLNTDAPDNQISLPEYTSMTFTQMFSTVTVGDIRTFVFIGPEGCFLLQVRNSDFSVEHYLEVNLASNLLYQAQSVRWVRLYNVESLESGQLLIGSVDTDGNTFETLLDIPTRSILHTWSASTLRNQFVTTGEILFQPESSYSGLPLPPVVNTPLYAGTLVTLTWSQTRPDLVTNYNIRYAANGGSFVSLGTTRPGSGPQFSVNLPGGNTYQFQVQAVGLDGLSNWSNIVG